MRSLAFALLLTACGASPTAPSATSCPAQDAQDDGTDCTTVIGYAFDGKRCFPITCGCTGADCGDLGATETACQARFGACF